MRAAGQLYDRRAGRGRFIAMRHGLLDDFDEMPAVLNKFTADDTVDDDRIAVRIVTANLAFTLPQETVIAHPVGDVMCQPGAALRAIIVSTRRADLERECFVPMNALGAIGHIEAIPDP